MTSVNLRIRATLREPVVYYGDGMHLDGILAYGAFLALPIEQRQALPPISSAWAEDFDLPLERWSVSSPPLEWSDERLMTRDSLLWGWRASAAHADWQLQAAHEVRKMPQIDEMKRRTQEKTAQISMGQLKACNISHPARWTRTVEWYARGDLAGVVALLDRVRSIGKMTGHGAGRVEEWSVEEIAEDRSLEYDGLLRRVMPLAYWPDAERVMISTIRPPYHHRSRQALCALPDYDALLPGGR